MQGRYVLGHGSFESGSYSHGDYCWVTRKGRTATVTFDSDPSCTNSASEPNTCHYELNVCACTGEDSKTKYDMPPVPTLPGCYVFMPNGCPKPNWTGANHKWHPDSRGSSQASALNCENRVKWDSDGYDKWCGKSDGIYYFRSDNGQISTNSYDYSDLDFRFLQHGRCTDVSWTRLGVPQTFEE
eukprot:UN23093